MARDGAAGRFGVVDVEQTPAAMAQADQSIDRRADALKLAAHTERLQRADALRLDQQARAHGGQLRVLFEDVHVVPLASKRDGGGEASVTGAGNADGQRAGCGHEGVADRLLKMITIRHAR